MRKLSFILIFSILLSMFSFSATAIDNSTVKVIVDGTAIKFDVAPFIEKGRVLVPLRATMEALGAEVNWDQTARTVTAKKGETVIVLTIDSLLAKVNNEVITLDVPAKIKNGRTFVPLRFLSEHLDADVQWDNQTRTVSIIQKSFFNTPLDDKELSLLGDRFFIKMPKGSSIVENRAGIMEAPTSLQEKTSICSVPIKDQSVYLTAREIFAYSSGNLKKDAESYWSHDGKLAKYYSLNEYKTKSGLNVILVKISEKLNDNPVMDVLVEAPDKTLIYLTFSATDDIYNQHEKCEKYIMDIIDTLRVGTRTLDLSEHKTIIGGMNITIAKEYVLTQNIGIDFDVYYLTKVGILGKPRASMGIYVGGYPSYSEEREGYPSSQIKRTKGTVLGKQIEWLYYGNSTVDDDSYVQTLVKLGDYSKIHIFISPTNKDDLEEMKQMAASLQLVK